MTPSIGSRNYSKMATSPQVETANTGADKARLAAAAALVVAPVVGFYLLGKQGALAQWATLIAGLVAAAGVFLPPGPGRPFLAFSPHTTHHASNIHLPTPH